MALARAGMLSALALVMRTFSTLTAATLSCVAVSAWTPSALAQTTEVTTVPGSPPVVTTTTTTPPPPPHVVDVTTVTSAPVASDPVVRDTHERYMPNRYLLASGLLVFGIPYTASVIVAATSGNPGDQHLYLPIVGPWLDIARRPGCPAANVDCDTETSNKVFLGIDGVLQGLGTLQFIWAFLRPEHEVFTTVAATRYPPKMTFLPAHVASGYGLTMHAEF
jgi:hypothetical protein